MVQKALEEFGRIDVLINNAGGSFVVMAMDMSENAWDAIVRENLKPVFLCSEIVGKVKLPEEVVMLQLGVMHQQVLTGLQTMEKGTFSGNTDSTPNVWYNQRNQFSVPVLITLI